MKRVSSDEIILQIIFLAAGIYILIRIFVPILNPASMATNSDYSQKNFYTELLNKANPTFGIATSEKDKPTTGILPILFTYLTGVDFNNPKTFIATELPTLNSIDNISLDSNEQPPVVVIPRDTRNSQNNNTSKNNVDKNPASQSKTSSGKDIPISTINPINENISKGKLNLDKPQVLIFHTHTTESYNPENLSEKNFSTDLNNTVAKVGTQLDYELENNYGISTIHDMTIHDLPTRNGAYVKARPTVEKYLKKYPGIKLIIDLHRDGEVSKNKYTALINNETYARVMFVAGIKFKNHAKNNKITQKFEGIFDYLYPNFSRGIDYKNSIYNQDLSPNMILIEVGTNGNSMDEALRTSKIIAKVVAKYLSK